MRRRHTQSGRDAGNRGSVRGRSGAGRPDLRARARAAAVIAALAVAAALAAMFGGSGARPAIARFLGMLGPETQATATTRANEDGGRVALASDAAGRIAIAWAYTAGAGATSDIYLRRYDAGGAPLSAEVRVNTVTVGNQGRPAIAMAADGRFVVAWSGPGQVGSGLDVFAQRYDAAGAPAGVEFRVNAATPGDQSTPAVAMTEDGSFVVAWSSVASDLTSRVMARRFSAAGIALEPGDDLEVAAVGLDSLAGVDVGVSSAGGFVVVWGRRGTSEAILGRRYAPDGTPSTEPFPIDGPAAATVQAPRIGMGRDGRFVAAWQRAAADGAFDVLARRSIDVEAGMGSPFVVNTTVPGDQVAPAVAVEADGDVVIAWSGAGPGDDSGIFFQRYAATGARQGDEAPANSTISQDQRAPAVAINGTGNFVVAWTSDLGLGQLHATLQRFAFNNPPVVTLSDGPLTYQENAGRVVVDPGATVIDVDSPTFANGSLSVTLASALPGDGLAIRDQGTGSGQIGTDGAGVTYAGRPIGTIDGSSGPSRLVINLNEAATPVATQALLRNVTFENGREDFAAASRTLTVVLLDDWGEPSAGATKTIALVPVDDAPVAGHDAYRVTAGTTLNVPAPGVLGNDSDVDSPLRATLVSGPTNGRLTLSSNGAFVYTPNAGFAGTDRFAYWPSDGPASTGAAAVSITVDPVACAPRPPVIVAAHPANGTLAVTIAAQRNALTPNNALVTVAIGDAQNATIEVPAQVGTAAQSGTGNFVVSLAPNTTELRFTVRRRAAGAVHVPLVVTDGCPPWPTFVGGGPTGF